jgi:hypothetical protein
MRLIGLMMIRDEQDMLREAIRNHVIFCDSMLVLDGTEGPERVASESICRSFEQVKEYWTDADTAYERPLRDGARQFLLERGRSLFGKGNWYVVLHGDEIWGQDPRPHLDLQPTDTQGIAIDLYHFFPHVSQRGAWNFAPDRSSIEALAQWYMLPPVWEDRLFFDSGEFDYEITRHSRTIPAGIQPRKTSLVVKQYNYRSPGQSHKRAIGRSQSDWQENHYRHLLDSADDFFVETLERDDGHWAGLVPIGKGAVANCAEHPLPTLRA